MSRNSIASGNIGPGVEGSRWFNVALVVDENLHSLFTPAPQGRDDSQNKSRGGK